MQIPQLQDFAGRWAVRREITDNLTGAQGRFEGQARFTHDKDGLIYDETGVLHLNGQALQAERRYLWRTGVGGLDVYFADGRYFHTLGEAAEHWCDPDQYDVRYDFMEWPLWRSVWRVVGPRKDYQMMTIYSKGAR